MALILYAYARGNRSSRAIERACLEDVAYRVIAAQRKPDHATIARFVERHQDALAGVFGEVLGLWIHTADSRAEWTRRLVRRLEDGAFTMAGEDPA